jgi:hypothetical protein
LYFSEKIDVIGLAPSFIKHGHPVTELARKCEWGGKTSINLDPLFLSSPHTHTHTYTHTHKQTHTHSRTHALIHTLTHTHTYSSTHAHAITHTHTHALKHSRTHTLTRTHTYSHEQFLRKCFSDTKKIPFHFSSLPSTCRE